MGSWSMQRVCGRMLMSSSCLAGAHCAVGAPTRFCPRDDKVVHTARHCLLQLAESVQCAALAHRTLRMQWVMDAP